MSLFFDSVAFVIAMFLLMAFLLLVFKALKPFIEGMIAERVECRKLLKKAINLKLKILENEANKGVKKK